MFPAITRTPSSSHRETAYHNGWITHEQVLKTYEILKKNQYGQYLKDVLDGKYIDKLKSYDK